MSYFVAFFFLSQGIFESFGEGTGPILLDEVTCAGSEQSIVDCAHNGWNTHDCQHSEDAGCRCCNDIENCVSPTLPPGVTGKYKGVDTYKETTLVSTMFHILIMQ